jgi:hypothetical protein
MRRVYQCRRVPKISSPRTRGRNIAVGRRPRIGILRNFHSHKRPITPVVRFVQEYRRLVVCARLQFADARVELLYCLLELLRSTSALEGVLAVVGCAWGPQALAAYRFASVAFLGRERRSSVRHRAGNVSNYYFAPPANRSENPDEACDIDKEGMDIPARHTCLPPWQITPRRVRGWAGREEVLSHDVRWGGERNGTTTQVRAYL